MRPGSVSGRLCSTIWLLLLLTPIGSVAGQLRLALPSGVDVDVPVYEGQGAATMLWLPSERGFVDAHREHARALARRGHRVLLADLHNAYFVETGRASISRFPVDDMVALIDAAVDAAAGDLVILSASRGAQLALIAAREWQLQNPGNTSIRGLILAHAHLYAERPAPGATADYLPIVQATNLPVFLLAAQYSTKFSRLQELAQALAANDGTVYKQVLSGVQGGFDTREAARSSAQDLAAKRAFAATLSRAAELLRRVPAPPLAVQTSLDTRRFSRESRSGVALTPIQPPLTAPALRLKDFDGGAFALDAYRGEVVLVNFWASWCRPCVTEIPSLNRLAEFFDGDDFRIVTVNVGEERQRVADFLQQVAVELPVLMDYDADISKGWKIYVYPSSYLVDHQGKIRYAYLGALQWDSAENINIIQKLLSSR